VGGRSQPCPRTVAHQPVPADLSVADIAENWQALTNMMALLRPVAGYRSITGGLLLMLDIADLATVNRILADKGRQTVFGEFYALTHFSNSRSRMPIR
jgi:hypothetical protein